MQLSHQTPRVHQMFQNVEAQNRIERALHRDQARYKGFIFHVADVRKIDTRTLGPAVDNVDYPDPIGMAKQFEAYGGGTNAPSYIEESSSCRGHMRYHIVADKVVVLRAHGGRHRAHQIGTLHFGWTRGRNACHPFDNMCHQHAPRVSTQSDRHVDSSVITSMASGAC